MRWNALNFQKCSVQKVLHNNALKYAKILQEMCWKSTTISTKKKLWLELEP